MNNPEIKLNQVAYVQITRDVLNELMPYGTAQGDETVLIPASVLIEVNFIMEIEDIEIVAFIDQVLKQVSGIDIIFHL